MENAQEHARDLLERAAMAAAVFSQFDQARTDAVVETVFQAAFRERVRLARMACEETGLGVFEHKVLKNVVATQLVYEDIKNEKTVGVISRDGLAGIVEIAQPLGPILAVTPVTNPTSTTLFKILIALKTRNPLIITPHKKAVKCCREAARICYEAALAADAPEDCIQCVEQPSRDLTHALMTHPGLALVLATGGPSLVKAAYSSGTPAIGVGPGNVPVFICRTADIPFAVESVVYSKTFDNGTICASEQAVVAERCIAGEVVREFERCGCHFMSPEEIRKVEKVAVDPATGIMTPGIIGRPAARIAEMAGISPPPDTKILMARLEGIGPGYPLSGEVLAPILAFYEGEDFNESIKLCIDINYLSGVGHTASIYSNDEDRILEFGQLMNAGRIVVNTPSAPGAVGGTFNRLRTSLTLGCGSGGKNITTENITAVHLLNIQRICRRRENEKWRVFPKEAYLDEGLDTAEILERYHRNF